MNNSLLLQRPKQSRVRDCPDLKDLANGPYRVKKSELKPSDRAQNTKPGRWHTMGLKLLPYVKTKFTNEQVNLIQEALLDKVPIEVHAIHEAQIPMCLSKHNFHQIQLRDGKFRSKRLLHNTDGKPFNFERPFFMKVANKLDPKDIRLWIITFPSEEYLNQNAELLHAFIKLNLQLLIQTKKEAHALGAHNEVASAFNMTRQFAKKALAWVLEEKPIRQFFYSNILKELPIWSSLDQLIDSNWILDDDVAIIGYVDQLRTLLIEKHDFRDLNDHTKFTKFGLNEMFGISVLISPEEKKRVVLVGCTHSFWGKPSAKIVETLLSAGARDIIYFAKAGTLTGKPDDDGSEDLNKHFTNIIGNNYFIWEGSSAKPEGNTRKVELNPQRVLSRFSNFENDEQSHAHISVPSVVGEDSLQQRSYNQFGPVTIDNEISYIADAISQFSHIHPNDNFYFTCVHLMTDLVVTRLTYKLSNEAGLDEDKGDTNYKRKFFEESAAKICSYICDHGLIDENDLVADKLFVTSSEPGRIIRFRPPSDLQTGDKPLYDRNFSIEKIVSLIKLFELRNEEADFFALLDSNNRLKPIVVSGESGVGKSVLAEASFSYLQHNFAVGKLQRPPVYFNFASFEKELIVNKNMDTIDVFRKAIELLEKEVNHKPSVIIFDGIDELSPFADLVLDFLDKLNKRGFLRGSNLFFFCRQYRNTKSIKGENKKVLGRNIGAQASFFIGHDVNAPRSTEKLQIKIAKMLAEITDVSFDKSRSLHAKMNTLPEFSVNLRLLHLVSKMPKVEELGLDPLTFFNEFFTRYAARHIEVPDIEEYFARAGKFSFDFLMKGVPPKLETWEDVFAKRISTQSIERMFFLAARHLDDQIFEKKNGDENRVFPYVFNKYAKELMLQRKDQAEVVNTIDSILKDDRTALQYRAFLTYLLGRISNPKLKNKCIAILNQQRHWLKQFKNKERISEKDALPLSSVYERSIEISLIYLGNSSERYINSMLKSATADEVNRGFHLAYYGDYNYFDNPTMLKRDDCSTNYTNTKHSLLKSIENTDNSNQFNLAVYTLFSLAYSRHANPDFDQKDVTQELIQLAKDKILNQSILFEDLRTYVECCVEFFESGAHPHALMINKTLELKNHTRMGWVDKKRGRDVNLPESVQAHVGYASYLASVYLPENRTKNERKELIKVFGQEFEDYDKYTILRMLLIHDIGEYAKGDTVIGKRDRNVKKVERDATFMFRILPRSIPHANLINYSTDVFELWEEFENNKTLNANIANDFDKIECLVQLENYAHTQPQAISDAKFWIGLYNAVNTDIGMRVLELVSSGEPEI